MEKTCSKGLNRQKKKYTQVVVCPCYIMFSNIFFSETPWPINAKLHVESPWKVGKEVYINGPGHMTKMATMPIHGKNI